MANNAGLEALLHPESHTRIVKRSVPSAAEKFPRINHNKDASAAGENLARGIGDFGNVG
jgi:hypothetical protein